MTFRRPESLLRRSTPAGLSFSCGIAALVACALIGPEVLLNPSRAVIGFNPASDFQIMTWSLEWWPWAIRHGLDPLHSRLLWHPLGFSTLWMTTIPVPALVGLPLTLTVGPLAAYNILMFAAILLATGSGYLLCREISNETGPAVFGGLLFGLSPYMLGHTLSEHLDLTFVWPIPLLAWLAIRCARGRTSPKRFVAGFALLLLALVGSSLELFLDATMIFTCGFVLAAIGSRSQRRSILRVGGLAALSYAVCLPVLVPLAVITLTSTHAALPYAPGDYAIDLLNIVVPTPTLLTGSLHATRALSRHFVGNIGEQDGYLGLPVIVISLLAIWKERRRGAWLGGALLAITIVLSLGPMLTIEGQPLFGLPFSTAHYPLLSDLLPARLSLFTALIAACLCSLWFSGQRRMWLRIAAGGVVAASLIPNFVPPTHLAGAWAVSNVFGWSTSHPQAGFVTADGWKQIVRPGSNVLVLPTGDRTAASYWQTQSGMRFELAIPATPFVPPTIDAEPIVAGLVDNSLPSVDGAALGGARLRAYLLADRISDVVVTRQALRRWRRIVATATNTQPASLAGALVYRVPRRLRPLHTNGELVVRRHELSAPRQQRRDSDPMLRAWLHFDGRRAHLEALFTGYGRQLDRSVTISSATGDAEATAAALGVGTRAAVAFTEWRDRSLLLRVATHTVAGWHVVTLDRRTQPIWSPHVTITSNGSTIVTWIDESDPFRTLRAAVQQPDGHWQDPISLDRADGLRTTALATRRAGLAIFVWTDSVANEGRIRLATYSGGTWRPAITIADSLHRLSDITIRGRHPVSVKWKVGIHGHAQFANVPAGAVA